MPNGSYCSIRIYLHYPIISKGSKRLLPPRVKTPVIAQRLRHFPPLPGKIIVVTWWWIRPQFSRSCARSGQWSGQVRVNKHKRWSALPTRHVVADDDALTFSGCNTPQKCPKYLAYGKRPGAFVISKKRDGHFRTHFSVVVEKENGTRITVSHLIYNSDSNSYSNSKNIYLTLSKLWDTKYTCIHLSSYMNQQFAALRPDQFQNKWHS